MDDQEQGMNYGCEIDVDFDNPQRIPSQFNFTDHLSYLNDGKNKDKNQPESDDQNLNDFQQNLPDTRAQTKRYIAPNMTKKSLLSEDYTKKTPQFLQYLRYFNPEDNLTNTPTIQKENVTIKIPQIDHLIKKLEKNQIHYKQIPYKSSKFIKNTQTKQNLNFQILSIKNSQSPEIFQFQILLGNFTFTLFVLQELQHFQDDSDRTENLLAMGSYGKIYRYQSFMSLNYQKPEKYVVKSTSIDTKNQFIHVFLSYLRQYSFSLIMSALQIGPKISRQWGFDIIVKETRIQFAMEFCSHYEAGKSQLENMSQDLKNCLQTMHYFRMIHHDIKPENVAFSFHFNKWVLIDFGLSKIIEERLGEKSMVKFLGTYQYTTEEMRATLSDVGLVDLYHNDLFGLQTTLRTYSFLQKFDLGSELVENQSINEEYCRENMGSNVMISWNPENQKPQDEQGLKTQRIQLFKSRKKNMNQLIYLFKHSVFVKNEAIICTIWQIFDEIFQFRKNQISIKYQQLVLYILNFMEKCPLTQFVKQIYQQIIKKSFQSYDFKQKIESKLSQSSVNPYVIKMSQKQSAFKNSKIARLHECNDEKSILKLIKKSQFFNFQNQNEIKNILLYKSDLMKKQEYYQLFFNYITFRQKIFNCSYEQKIQATQVFMQNLAKNIRNSNFFIDYNKIDPKISKGRSQIINALKFLIEYCTEEPLTEFKKNFYVDFVTEYVFVNPLILIEENLDKNEELQFVKNLIKISEFFTQFLVKCWRVKEAFRLLNYKSSHPYTTYFSNENTFEKFVLLFLKEKQLLEDMDEKGVLLLIENEKKSEEAQIIFRGQNKGIVDMKDGFRLLRILQKLGNENSIEDLKIMTKQLVVQKNIFEAIEFDETILSELSSKDRIYLIESVQRKLIKIRLVANISAQEKQQLETKLNKYKNQKQVSLKLFETIEKFTYNGDFKNQFSLLQRIEYLINSHEISSQYLTIHRIVANSLHGNVDSLISETRLLIENIKTHLFGFKFLIDTLKFFKPIRYRRFNFYINQKSHKQLQEIQIFLYQKIFQVLEKYVSFVDDPENEDFQTIRDKMSLLTCKSNIVDLLRYICIGVITDSDQQNRYYETYDMCFENLSRELIDLRFERILKASDSPAILQVAEIQRQRQIEMLEVELAKFSVQKQMHLKLYDELLEQHEAYEQVFKRIRREEYLFFANFLKILIKKNERFIHEIYRSQWIEKREQSPQKIRFHYKLSPQKQKQQKLSKKAKKYTKKLADYLKFQSNCQSLSCFIGLIEHVTIHYWYEQNSFFFQYIVQRLGKCILCDPRISFGEAYYHVVETIEKTIMRFQPERQNFVDLFVLYAEKNIVQKMWILKEGKHQITSLNLTFYEVFVILHITYFFTLKQSQKHLKFVLKVLKISIESLENQTNFSRPLSKHFIYAIYSNLISSEEIILQMEKFDPLLFRKEKLLSKSYKSGIKRKLIKQNSMDKKFSSCDSPKIIRNFLELRKHLDDCEVQGVARRKLNEHFQKISRNMQEKVSPNKDDPKR